MQNGSFLLQTTRFFGTIAVEEYSKGENAMNDFDFGNYLCGLRVGSGLSQKELAARLGVSDKAVSKWENGGSLR